MFLYNRYFVFNRLVYTYITTPQESNEVTDSKLVEAGRI